MKEEWKTLPCGNYEISNRGNARRCTPGRKTYAGRPLALTKMKIGYYIVQPVINGRNKPFYVHRLVAEHFIGPCPDGCEVNHRDGNKTNNHVSNLEYVTHKENVRHAFASGLVNTASRLTERDIQEIKESRLSGLSYSKIAKKHGVCIAHAWNICNGKRRRKSA